MKYDKEQYQTPDKDYPVIEKWQTIKADRRHVYNNLSFDGNQSYPRISRAFMQLKMEFETPPKSKQVPDLVRVDGPNGLRFNSTIAAAGEVGGCLLQTQSERWHPAISSSRAVFTIDPSNNKILIVNNKASSLLGYSSSELCGLRFQQLLKEGNPLLMREEDNNEDGTIVLLSGKVVELISKEGNAVQVSLWIRQLDNDGPCLVVAEPVNCKHVVFIIDAENGQILTCENEEAAILFQAECLEKLIGLPITTLIPSINLPVVDRGAIPKILSKQKAAGKTLDGVSFPLCLWITKLDNYKDRALYELTIRVTYNVSGLLVIDDNGIITACNHHFSMLTFGKPHNEVIGQNIEEIIQNFCQDVDLIKLNIRNRDMTLSPVNNNHDGSVSDTDEDSCGAFNGSQKSACMSLNVNQSQSAATRDKSCITHTPTPTQDMVSSISTTEQFQGKDISALPDATSGFSGLSIDDENYALSSISKSRSENILRSEHSNSRGLTNLEEYYATECSRELTPTGTEPKIRSHDPSLRLSFDSSKYRKQKDDKSSLSLDFCDSNETSADFLTPINEMPASGCEIDDFMKHNGMDSVESLSNDVDLETQTESAPKRREDEEIGTPYVNKRVLCHVQTSTPQVQNKNRDSNTRSCDITECPTDVMYKDGTYRGVVLHRDGTELGVIYTVSSMQISGRGNNKSRYVRCVWLAVQLDDAPPRHTTLASSITSTTDNSLAMGGKSTSSRPHSMSLMSQCGEEQVSGEFNKHYVTLKQIGKGAYGCVKMAYRRSDKLLTVAKFILKEKVGAHFWVDGPEGKKVPLELSLLLTLKHPNIVSVMDVFENEKYFQMVMEKHGAGMDLFEFIERRPQLDEPLVSYIFRQIGQAVEYLHSLNILHRDIKDENVIIDNRFQIKLIDFGSATFMSKDTLFSTFYGTTEYCSPEVLAGNKYAGPELEMWSMGITLYVLTFFVNPFSDIEDTIQGPLVLAQAISEDLEHLLHWMLCKDPTQRCTVTQLMSHAWIRQPVAIDNYVFHEILDCDRHEVNPDTYYSGSLSPHTHSLVSLAGVKEPSLQSEVAIRSDDKNVKEKKRNSHALHALSTADKDAQSDNYSLRSSADILDISSKPVSEAALTDISSDATGHAACDIDYDCDHYDCDSWDECEQDSFS